MSTPSANQTTPKGLVFLPSNHPILEQQLRNFLLKFGHGTPDEVAAATVGESKNRSHAMDLRFADFDDTRYQLLVPREEPTKVIVSIAADCIRQLKEKQLLQAAIEKLGSLVTTAMDGADFSVQFDPESLPMPYNELIDMVSNLRTILIGSPLTMAFNKLNSGSAAEPVDITFPHNEHMYILPGEERVAVSYALRIPEETDRAVARIVMQEFVEAQRRVNGAPPCTFNDPRTSTPFPKEIANAGLQPAHDVDELLGYITFTVFKTHTDTPEKLERAVTLFSGFRNYLQYHLKATKGFVQMRMRNRFEKLLQVLRRANVSDPLAVNQKKLSSGRTYTPK